MGLPILLRFFCHYKPFSIETKAEGEMSDEIATYYKRIEERRKAEEAKLAKMVADGVSDKEIQKQKDKVHWAGYTGD